MRVAFLGGGVWARGLCGIEDLQRLLVDEHAQLDAAFVAPKPTAIAPKERRRTGLMINLAVEVAHQACEQAAVNKQLLPSVFTSAMGDTNITDYMCRKLAQPEKMLSPTKFHNSVHNAPSGYWTISAENRAPSSFVGGFLQSFGAALLEAGSQACAHRQPVLLVAHDIATSTPFDDIAPVKEHLGVALVLAPADCDVDPFAVADAAAEPAMNVVAELEYGAVETRAAGSSLPQHPALLELATANPVGAALALLEALYRPDPTTAALAFAAAPSAQLRVSFAGGAL